MSGTPFSNVNNIHVHSIIFFTDPLPAKDMLKLASLPHFYDTKQRKTAGEILPETRKLLKQLFTPYNEKLADILGDQRFNYNTSK